MSKARSKAKYPALDKKFTLKIRQDLIDQDYIEKLSEEEKDWLNRFNEEYVNAKMDHKGKKLHRTKKMRKTIWKLNNDRNQDAYSKAKAREALKMGENRTAMTSINEDTMIDNIDANNDNTDEQ